ncbi:hypothetical protein, partial [Aequorivita sp. 609]|uniref:hypothetical protein n=1 Tax=Aequorivita sp. 609 TaxID=2760087 RepID=UPI001C885D0C
THRSFFFFFFLLICGLKVLVFPLLLIEELIHHGKDNQPKKKQILSKIEWCLGHRPRAEGLVFSERIRLLRSMLKWPCVTLTRVGAFAGGFYL